MRLINGYGPTENTTFAFYHVMDGQTRSNGSVPIGRPITNTEVYVLDGEMQVAPVGVVGELYIGGAGLARGYFNQPELTAESFVPHPHSAEAGARLYRTGDLVRWQESGELEFIGRVDGQVKVRGFRIEVGEIEAVLAGHEGVREAVVLVREDERGDKRLVAYVVKRSGERSFRRRVARVSAGAVAGVHAGAVGGGSGGVAVDGERQGRSACVAGTASGAGEAVSASVRRATPAEEFAGGDLGRGAGARAVGVHDNFFELGGHSLLATQVISRVRDAFGQEVALRSLFEQPTVAGLAQSIESGQRAGSRSCRRRRWSEWHEQSGCRCRLRNSGCGSWTSWSRAVRSTTSRQRCA